MAFVFRRGASRDDAARRIAAAGAARAASADALSDLARPPQQPAAGTLRSAGHSPWGWLVAIAVLAVLATGLRRLRSNRALGPGAGGPLTLDPDPGRQPYGGGVPVAAATAATAVAEPPVGDTPPAEAAVEETTEAGAAVEDTPPAEAPVVDPPPAEPLVEDTPPDDGAAESETAPAVQSSVEEPPPAEAPSVEPVAGVPIAEPEAPAPSKTRQRARSVVELVVTIAVAAGIALLVQALLVKPYKIPSSSMEPTLTIGQRVLVNRLDTTPAIGDIVVFHPPVGADPTPPVCGNRAQGADNGVVALLQPCDKPLPKKSSETFIKRVVGLPGDVLQIINGHVIRNGKREHDPYINPCGTGSTCTYAKAIRVPPGMYYMMGDNRGISDDSRFWGPVPKSWIIGVAFFTYWPPDRIGTL